MLIPCDEVNILNTFRVMIILRLLLLLTNLHLKLLSTQGTGADKLLSTQRVNRNLKGCPKKLRNTAYISLIRPALEYSCSVWHPHKKSNKDKIEKVQRRAARFV